MNTSLSRTAVLALAAVALVALGGLIATFFRDRSPASDVLLVFSGAVTTSVGAIAGLVRGNNE